MVYDAIIFDLDGTLWDASEACAIGWNKALATCEIKNTYISAEDIRRVCGMPFKECVSTLLNNTHNADLDNLSDAIDQEENRQVALLGGDLYDGVKTGIAELAKDYPLYLVSNCQDWYLETFLNTHNVQRYFAAHDCHGRSGVSKTEMIRNISLQYKLKNPIYIGDTKGDHVASQNAGVAFGLVTYGFGTTANPEQSFASFAELTAWFKGLNP